MPEVILSYPRVPHPDTDDLLHGGSRRDAELNAVRYEKGKFLLADRGSAMSNTTSIGTGKSSKYPLLLRIEKEVAF